MAEVTFNVTPATPQKRSLEEDCITVETHSANTATTKSTTSANGSISRQASPAPSTSSSLTELTMTHDATDLRSQASPGRTDGSATKKRKLNFVEAQAEKAAKQREKDERARQKAEEKARKDEEKRRVAEEKENAKRAKELEKAEKQKVKDEEKQKKDAEKAKKDAEKKAKDAEKEAEKQRKEAEKLKRERSQMRLGAFFAKPKDDETPPSTPEDVSEGASTRRSSIASINSDRPVFQLPILKRPSNPDYEKSFLPFFVPEHTEVAPANRLKLSKQLDFELSHDTTAAVCNLGECFGRPRKRLKMTIPVRDIVQNIQAADLDVVDLDSTARHALSRTSYKCLQFREDVRPPYQGTYTRSISPRKSRQLCCNPFTRCLPDKNYDYDSEAEWEPPGEDDEDLDDEDEMSDADDAGDEMADFLDDAEDILRRRGPTTDMEPVSSGLCWAGESYDDHGLDIEQYRMNVLHDLTVFPIDPHSDTHWIDEAKPNVQAKQDISGTSSMQPPRQPLSSLSPNTPALSRTELGVDGKPLPAATSKTAATAKKPVKLVDEKLLPDFKKAIEGSSLTKIGLIEILKQQFPQCSKDAIKGTLESVAERVGKKEVDKKWQLVGVTA